eukprot:5640518-Pleurochrysis_carterae.AAC.2
MPSSTVMQRAYAEGETADTLVVCPPVNRHKLFRPVHQQLRVREGLTRATLLPPPAAVEWDEHARIERAKADDVFLRGEWRSRLLKVAERCLDELRQVVRQVAVRRALRGQEQRGDAEREQAMGRRLWAVALGDGFGRRLWAAVVETAAEWARSVRSRACGA